MSSVNSRKKLLLVGGPDVMVARRGIANYLKNDFIVGIVGSTKQEPRLSEAADDFFYLYYPLKREANITIDLFALLKLIQIFIKERPSIVHAFDTKPTVLARLAAKIARVPITVGSINGRGSLYTEGEKTKLHQMRGIYEMLQKIACHTSDMTIFQHINDSQYFLERKIAPPEKTSIISGSGVDTDLFSRDNLSKKKLDDLKRQIASSQDVVIVTMISRILRSKGILEFVQAANIVKNKFPTTLFLLVGPDDFDSMERLNDLEKKEVSQSVTWLGERKNIVDILAISDIFVLPSYYKEGIPRTLLEAASMSLPIITTDIPGCQEVVKQNLNGFLVKPRDPMELAAAIIQLVQNPELRQRFGKESRHLIESNFSFQIIASKIREVYFDLMKKA